MTIQDIERKQLILIDYLKTIIPTEYKVVAEFKTNQNNNKVNNERIIVVQEQAGTKQVLYCGDKLYNYYMIDIFANSIQDAKNVSLLLGNLIGEHIYYETEYENPDDGKTYEEKWQILIKQYGNPQAISYEDIRRVGYSSILLCIVNKYYSVEKTT